ncbi:hypothetical protein Pan181_05370 [Aeoliella mucimassa]|uniref:Uncharacterized protein n=1 Tax=Aeoliella mucimassa TaxID=2527972 RepID=A0A518AHZ9_9BACT|nr:hypothetical protein Pan181_05370 [Aeoliella mucimassa]
MCPQKPKIDSWGLYSRRRSPHGRRKYLGTNKLPRATKIRPRAFRPTPNQTGAKPPANHAQRNTLDHIPLRPPLKKAPPRLPHRTMLAPSRIAPTGDPGKLLADGLECEVDMCTLDHIPLQLQAKSGEVREGRKEAACTDFSRGKNARRESSRMLGIAAGTILRRPTRVALHVSGTAAAESLRLRCGAATPNRLPSHRSDQ